MKKDDLQTFFFILLTLLAVAVLVYVSVFAPCDALGGLPLQSIPARCLSLLSGR